MKKRANGFGFWILSISLVIGSTVLLTILQINFNLNYLQQVVIGLCSLFPAILFHLDICKMYTLKSERGK